MARLTKQQEFDRYIEKMFAYSWKLKFKNYDINATIIATSEETALKTLDQIHPNYDSKELIFVSNRIHTT